LQVWIFRTEVHSLKLLTVSKVAVRELDEVAGLALANVSVEIFRTTEIIRLFIHHLKCPTRLQVFGYFKPMSIQETMKANSGS
jgi:hypothetical protein